MQVQSRTRCGESFAEWRGIQRQLRSDEPATRPRSLWSGHPLARHIDDFLTDLANANKPRNTIRAYRGELTGFAAHHDGDIAAQAEDLRDPHAGGRIGGIRERERRDSGEHRAGILRHGLGLVEQGLGIADDHADRCGRHLGTGRCGVCRDVKRVAPSGAQQQGGEGREIKPPLSTEPIAEHCGPDRGAAQPSGNLGGQFEGGGERTGDRR